MLKEAIRTSEPVKQAWGEYVVLADCEDYSGLRFRISKGKQFPMITDFMQAFYTVSGKVQITFHDYTRLLETDKMTELYPNEEVILTAKEETDLLIFKSKRKMQKVALESIIDKGREHQDEHVKTWGTEDWIVNNPQANYCGKLLRPNPQHQCSIHYHKKKKETFYVLSGIVMMEWHDSQGNCESALMKQGEALTILPGQKHRFGSLIIPTVIAEFSTTHAEEDSYREEASRTIPESEWNDMLKKSEKEIQKYLKDLNSTLRASQQHAAQA